MLLLPFKSIKRSIYIQGVVETGSTSKVFRREYTPRDKNH